LRAQQSMSIRDQTNASGIGLHGKILVRSLVLARRKYRRMR
jgi:hypothetical protein